MSLNFNQRSNCLGCSNKDRNIYVDDIIQVMIDWLTAYTCIPWIRSHENIDRPDKDGNVLIGDGIYLDSRQPYGMIEITNISRKNTNKPVRDYIGDSGNLGCYVIHETKEANINLTVFRESGESNRNQVSQDENQVVFSAPDVLDKLRAIYNVDRVARHLNNHGISIKQVDDDIAWLKFQKNEIWENQPQMGIIIKYCATHSITDRVINCINLEICGNENELICKDDNFEGC